MRYPFLSALKKPMNGQIEKTKKLNKRKTESTVKIKGAVKKPRFKNRGFTAPF